VFKIIKPVPKCCRVHW